MRADLFPRARLAGAQLDVARDELVPAVHLPLVGEDDLAAAAGRVDRHRLLEALLDVRRPDALSVLTLYLRSSRSHIKLKMATLVQFSKEKNVFK